MTTTNNIYVDRPLTNLAVAYRNNNYIAEVLFPRVKVDDLTGIYFEFDKDNLRPENDERAPGTEANEVGFELKQQTFGPLVDHSLRTKITAEEMRIASRVNTPLRPLENGTTFVTDKLLLGKEIDAANKLAATTNGVNLSGTSQWNDYANSDPIADIQTGFDDIFLRSFVKPNIMAMGYQVYSSLKHHPDLENKLSANVNKVLSQQILAEFFGVKRVVIGDAAKNTAIKGATDAVSYVWGKNVYLMYVAESPDLMTPSAAYTLDWQDGAEVTRWWEQKVKSWFIESCLYYEQKLTSTNAIYKIASAIA